MKRSKLRTTQDKLLRSASVFAGPLRVQMEKGIQFRLKSLAAFQIEFDDFDGRELFRTDTLGNLLDRGVGRKLHDSKREIMRAIEAGQAPHAKRAVQRE